MRVQNIQQLSLHKFSKWRFFLRVRPCKNAQMTVLILLNLKMWFFQMACPKISHFWGFTVVYSVGISDPKIGSTRPFWPEFRVISTQGLEENSNFGSSQLQLLRKDFNFFKSTQVRLGNFQLFQVNFRKVDQPEYVLVIQGASHKWHQLIGGRGVIKRQ